MGFVTDLTVCTNTSHNPGKCMALPLIHQCLTWQVSHYCCVTFLLPAKKICINRCNAIKKKDGFNFLTFKNVANDSNGDNVLALGKVSGSQKNQDFINL